MVIKKLLVANRGEIALRVMRACRELGITPVAIYSEADRDALHVRYADESYLIGPAPVTESYLNMERIVETARQCGADAVHPGYGLLSENAAFAEACANAGIIFVGPPVEAMQALGDKSVARRIAKEAGAPIVPGTDELTSWEEAEAAAARIGYPIMIKASAGGGGRGIRVVQRPEDLADTLQIASGEAKAAFGHGGVYLEKYLLPVRHIEVQVVGDKHGNVVALGERECSIQRRHQKIIEEAPSPAVDADLRQRFIEAAVAVAKAAGYYSVGTFEFLMDAGSNFYFMEANTRLQVEHPVTEMITGIDLVCDQIRLAMGERLPYRQDEITFRGASIECRITAEDPFNNFMPSLGRIEYVQEPSGPGVRVDSALYSGLEVMPYYDSLIAKLITWGRDRTEAIARMKRALQEYHIGGIITTIPFHLQILDHPDFVAGRLDTGFVERNLSTLKQLDGHHPDLPLVAAALIAREIAREIPTNGRSGGAAAEVKHWRLAGRSRLMSARQIGTGAWRWRNSI